MTKAELLERFTKDLPELSGSHLTDPMNTRHADMYLAYEAGYNLSLRIPPKPDTRRVMTPGESERTKLNRRITKHLEINSTLVAYYDSYNTKIKLRNKLSSACEEDLHTQRIGVYTDAKTAKSEIAEYL